VQEDTNIRLRMNRSLCVKIRNPQMMYKRQPYRDGSTINLDLRGLNNITPIVTKPVYEESKKSESPHYSPTASQILNTLSKEEPFIIDKNWIRKDFESGYNKERREWYFKAYTKQQTEHFRQEFYNYLNQREINLYFFL